MIYDTQRVCKIIRNTLSTHTDADVLQIAKLKDVIDDSTIYFDYST